MALLDQDKEILYQVLKDSSKTEVALIEAAIAKIYLASPDPRRVRVPEPYSFLRRFPQLSSHTWTDSSLSGVICLVYELTTNQLYFKMLSLSRRKILFSYEIYLGLKFIKMNEDLQCFEMDDCVMGFAFADRKSAAKFYLMTDIALDQFNRLNSPQAQAGFSLRDGVPMGSNTNISGSKVSPYNSGNTLSGSVKTPNLGLGRSSANGKSKKPVASVLGMGSSNVRVLSKKEKKAEAKRKKAELKKQKAMEKKMKKNQNKLVKAGTLSNVAGSVTSSKQVESVGGARPSPLLQTVSPVIKTDPRSQERGVSFNVDGSVDLKGMDTNLKRLFKQAGVKKKELKNAKFSMELFRDIQKKEMIWEYKEKEEFKNADEAKLEAAAEEKLDEYNNYIDQMDNFQAAKANEENLQKWQKEQAPPLPNREATVSSTTQNGSPPRPPPRPTLTVAPKLEAPPEKPKLDLNKARDPEQVKRNIKKMSQRFNPLSAEQTFKVTLKRLNEKLSTGKGNEKELVTTLREKIQKLREEGATLTASEDDGSEWTI